MKAMKVNQPILRSTCSQVNPFSGQHVLRSTHSQVKIFLVQTRSGPNPFSSKPIVIRDHLGTVHIVLVSTDATMQGRRNVWKSGVPVLFGGSNLPPLVEIRLTNLPKSGGAMDGTPGTPRDDRPVVGDRFLGWKKTSGFHKLSTYVYCSRTLKMA